MKKTMNLPFLGEIPSYLVMASIGFLITSIVIFYYEKNAGYEIKKITKKHFICIIGLLIGMKLFGMLSVFLDMLFHRQPIDFHKIIDSGIVFYGGLFGYYIVRRIVERKEKNKSIFDILAFCFPMFSIFGRIGCFLAGCCYGKPTNSIIGIPMKEEDGLIIKRIPTQLIESLANVILTIAFIILYHKKKDKDGQNVYYYFTFYSIFRFIIEFFRGDKVRGVYGFISFSQMISIFLLIYSIYKIKRGVSNSVKWN